MNIYETDQINQPKIETEQDIKELALRYLDKYQPSKKDLKLYLFRKIQANPYQLIPKNEIMTKIQSVVDDLENLNVLNDELYSELKSKKFLKRGYSINKIRMQFNKQRVLMPSY